MLAAQEEVDAVNADQLAMAGLLSSLVFLMLLGVIAVVQTIRANRWRDRCDIATAMVRSHEAAPLKQRRYLQLPHGRRSPRRVDMLVQHQPTAVMPLVVPGEETSVLPQVARGEQTEEIDMGRWSR